MNKRIVILGAGESGIGAALLAKKKGLDVFVSDNGKITPQAKQELEQHEIPFEEGRHTEELILNADEIIKSPGIPETAPIIVKVMKNEIPISSEIEFAGNYSKAFKIGITGSNGKTTTTLWIYHILKKAGMDVIVAGNVGNSYARALCEHDPKFAVLELSSFQLDDMYDFMCNIAIITNITPDHLDRYNNNFQQYIDSKFRITQNQSCDDVFIYNADDIVIQENVAINLIYSELVSFSLYENDEASARLNGDKLVFSLNNKEIEMPIEKISLKGKHNLYNAMCAGLVGMMLDIPEKVIIAGLSDFPGVEHRLEFVDKINGVTYINDSKATNVDSAWYALDSMTEPVIWIAGGTDKGNNYSVLDDLVKEKVKALICLGVDNSKLLKNFNEIVPVIKDTHSMEEALNCAFEIAQSGETVLLSPACASFDLFNNYEHRGKMFKDKILEMKNHGRIF
jgi:UDP-N-acetylmuramoylalanine--D-glutamate ligase